MVLMCMIMPFLSVFIVSLALFAVRRAVAERIAVSALSLWLAFESVLGIKQLLGMAISNHNLYLMTGSFENPGPYGGFIAVCTAVALYAAWKWYSSEKFYDRTISLISGISGALGLIILPASMSRAGWVALIISSVFSLIVQPVVRKYFRTHKLIVVISLVVLAIGFAGAFCIKKDSARGRFHIWKMELLAIADRPIAGHGFEHALGAYGDAQAEYFESADRGPEHERIASCPEYAFNEYLRFGIEFGVFGFLLAVAVIVLGTMSLYRVDSALTYGIIAWGVFAFASYPMSVWQLCVLLSVFLGAAVGADLNLERRRKFIVALFSIVISVGCTIWWRPRYELMVASESKWHEEQQFAGFGIYDGVSDSLAVLYPWLKKEYRYLYDYGYALHKVGHYKKSNEILYEGASMSSDPMFYDIIGKNYEALGDYEMAKQSWLHAHYMVPSRLYPYILLMEMCDRRGDRREALVYAEKVLSMQVNYRNIAMRELYEKAERYYDEHEKNN